MKICVPLNSFLIILFVITIVSSYSFRYGSISRRRLVVKPSTTKSSTIKPVKTMLAMANNNKGGIDDINNNDDDDEDGNDNLDFDSNKNNNENNDNQQDIDNDILLGNSNSNSNMNDAGHVIPLELNEELKNSFLSYAMSTILG